MHAPVDHRKRTRPTKCTGTNVCGNSFTPSLKQKRNFPAGTFSGLVIETGGYPDLVIVGTS
jgi:hypothetical protein